MNAKGAGSSERLLPFYQTADVMAQKTVMTYKIEDNIKNIFRKLAYEFVGGQQIA
jgi:hypothetical protein